MSTRKDEPGQRRVKSKASCCVPECNTPGYICENGKSITFHKLPLKNKELLDKWIAKMRRDPGQYFKVTDHTRICSRHFKDEDVHQTPSGRRRIKEGAVPTVFHWRPDKSRRPIVRINPPSATAVSVRDEVVPSHEERISGLELQLARERQKTEIMRRERDHVRSLLSASMEQPKRPTFGIESFKDSNKDVCFYTGFPTYKTFQECYDLLNPEGNLMYKDAKGASKKIKDTKLSYPNQFFLTLVRLRLGLLEKDLAQRFIISQSTVNRYFTAWLNYMYLKLGSINIWPSKDDIQRTMPESMKAKFPNLEWIIDAFEIQTQRPGSLLLQSQSYSNYKSRNTVKGLVACTPSGQLGFVSQLYTGNISDRELVIRSGFLQMPHTRGASWLVDKGFQIADLAEPLGVTVNMPAFVGSRGQMSQTEVFLTQSIASERIHIERAINKVKRFHFFDRPIQMSAYGSTNQAWAVCCLLTLFQTPIISA